MRRNVRFDDENGEIKKGPWKVEEDEVLINHVRKYGPRDWSSIRSKGLLQRTGKSCRLRWVNKLRPNLKTGVKFSVEEERTVIELQGEFGNKWAKIATYLPGRTDNDVKNFWSSRQKRLNRILQNSVPSSSRSHKTTNDVQPDFHEVPFIEAPKFSSSTEEESLTKSQSCSSSHFSDLEMLKMLPLPELLCPTFTGYEQSPISLDYNPPDKNPFADPQSHFSFPQIPPDFPMPPFGDANFLDVFGHSSGPPLGTSQIPIMASSFGPDRSCRVPGAGEGHETVIQDTYIDDFPPIDMFDHIEPLPSPSEWS